jgi:uncharacterized membrane protein
VSHTPETARSSTVRFPLLAGAASVAALVAGYLLLIAVQQKGLPVGCGEHGGCAEVLSSRWSSLAGVPVSALALALYSVLVVLALKPAWTSTAFFFRTAAVMLLLGAAWFVGLQAFVLRAFCPWCLGEHLLGIVVAVFASRAAAVLSVSGPSRTSRPGTAALGNWGRAVTLGTMAIVLLAVGQATIDPPATTVRLEQDEAPSEADGDQGDQVETVKLLSGHLQINPRNEPRVGSNLAAHTVYLMFDYCCPHCRRTHEYLQTIQQEQPERLAIVALPMPRDADCNSALTETEERFEHACELADLALSVWRADPDAFVALDRWLFAQPQPPTLDEALQQAEQWVDAVALAEARQSGFATERIQRNVNAYNASAAEYLPVLMAPGMSPVVGRPESEAALREILERDLFSRAPKP